MAGNGITAPATSSIVAPHTIVKYSSAQPELEQACISASDFTFNKGIVSNSRNMVSGGALGERLAKR